MCPTIIIARQIAVRRVKAELAAQGIKLHQVKALDIKRWAEAYLNAELLAEADAIIEASPELKRIAERQQKLTVKSKATSEPGREASPAKPGLLVNRYRQSKLIEDALRRAVQKTSLRRRAKRPTRLSCVQHEFWPTETFRYPYRTSQ